MSNDAQGNPIVEGSKYLEAATAKQDADGKVTLGDGARVALPGDLYPTSALGGGGGGGVTDHGALIGLGDDDHLAYHNDARGDARYYTKAAVDSALAGKANSSHTHTLSEITDAGTAAAADTGDFAAASHTHTLSDVTDSGALAALDTVGTSQIDDDAVTYAKLQNVSATDRILGRSTAGAGNVEEILCTPAGRALLDDADAAAQRATLGLGTAAVEPASAFAAASHTHTASDVTDLGDSATKDVGTSAGTVAAGDHGHTLAAISDAGDAAGKNTGTTSGTVAAGDHNHTGTYSPVGHTHIAADITDLGDSATRDVGTAAGTVAAGDHTHTLAAITDAGNAAGLDVGTTAGTVAAGDHNHSGVYAPVSHSHVVADITDAGALAALDTVGTSEISDDAVTYAKVQNVSATDRILGRSTAGAGVIEEIPCTAAGRALLDDANAAAQRTTLGLGSAAVEDASAFAAASHTHTLSQITDAGTAAAADTGDFLPASTDLDDLSNVNTLGKANGAQLQWDGTAGEWVSFTPPILPAYLQQANNLSDLASAATARTNLGLGTAAEEDSSAFAAAAHTHATEFRWLRQQENPSWIHSGGWAGAVTGSGIQSVAPGQFYAGGRSADVLLPQRVSTGGAASGTNAAVRRTSNTNALYMPDGRITIMRMSFENFAEIESVRIGYYGSATAPASTGRPSNALFVELDKGVGTDWYLVGTVGGTPSTDASGVTADGSDITFAIEYISSSSVKLWQVTDSAAPTELAQITTNILSSTTERSGGVFAQVVKRTSGVTSANGHVVFDVFPVLATNSVLVLP